MEWSVQYNRSREMVHSFTSPCPLLRVSVSSLVMQSFISCCLVGHRYLSRCSLRTKKKREERERVERERVEREWEERDEDWAEKERQWAEREIQWAERDRWWAEREGALNISDQDRKKSTDKLCS